MPWRRGGLKHDTFQDRWSEANTGPPEHRSRIISTTSWCSVTGSLPWSKALHAVNIESDFVLREADCALCQLSNKAVSYINAFVRLLHLRVTVIYNWKAWNANGARSTDTYSHTKNAGMVLISSCTLFN
jgi:hypothetical protein